MQEAGWASAPGWAAVENLSAFVYEGVVSYLHIYLFIYHLYKPIFIHYRSLWPRGLKRGSVAACLLGLRVRIPSEQWLYIFCECRVLGRVLCDRPITHPEEFNGVRCVCVWSWNVNNEEAGPDRWRLSSRDEKNSIIPPFIYLFIYIDIYKVIYSSICLFILLFRHSCINLVVCLLIYSFLRAFFYSFICGRVHDSNSNWPHCVSNWPHSVSNWPHSVSNWPHCQ